MATGTTHEQFDGRFGRVDDLDRKRLIKRSATNPQFAYSCVIPATAVAAILTAEKESATCCFAITTPNAAAAAAFPLALRIALNCAAHSAIAATAAALVAAVSATPADTSTHTHTAFSHSGV